MEVAVIVGIVIAVDVVLGTLRASGAGVQALPYRATSACAARAR